MLVDEMLDSVCNAARATCATAVCERTYAAAAALLQQELVGADQEISNIVALHADANPAEAGATIAAGEKARMRLLVLRREAQEQVDTKWPEAARHRREEEEAALGRLRNIRIGRSSL